MRVAVTLDKVDGSKSKSRDLDLEGASMTDLIFMMMSPDVVGVTITKKSVLHRLQQLKEES